MFLEEALGNVEEIVLVRLTTFGIEMFHMHISYLRLPFMFFSFMNEGTLCVNTGNVLIFAVSNASVEVWV